MTIIIIISIVSIFILLKKYYIRKKVKNNVSISIRNSYTAPKIVSYKERIKTAYKDKHGLYPHEILLLGYAQNYYANENQFQSFWLYKYGIKDCKKLLNSLVQRNFLEIKINLKANLEKQSTDSLKKLLKTYNLSTTGKKEDLIERLSQLEEIQLPNEIKKESFILTEKGINSLKESEYITYIHKHPVEGLDIWNLNILIHTSNKLSYRDIIWEFLNKKSISYSSQGNFGLYRNCKLAMYNFVYEEKKYKVAYSLLLEIIYLDINSYLGNNFEKEFIKLYLDYYFNSQNLERISKTIIGYMNDLQEKLNITDETLQNDFITIWAKYHFPIHIFDSKQCSNIYFLEKEEKISELKKIYYDANKKFSK